MGLFRFLKIALIILISSSIFNSCKESTDDSAFVTFGANYHIMNCISNVTIYVENESIGKLTRSTDTIINCGDENNITKELTLGSHSYKIEIRPQSGSGCTKE